MPVSENLVCLLWSGCGDVTVAEGSGSFEGFSAAATGPAHHQPCLSLVSLLLAHSTTGGHMKVLDYLRGYRRGGHGRAQHQAEQAALAPYKPLHPGIGQIALEKVSWQDWASLRGGKGGFGITMTFQVRC